jgi:hypothetical protein
MPRVTHFEIFFLRATGNSRIHARAAMSSHLKSISFDTTNSLLSSLWRQQISMIDS